MSNRKQLQFLSVFLLLDGISLLIGGRAYARLWQLGPPESAYRRAMAWLARRPSWLLRVAGAAETGLGLAALEKAPVAVKPFYGLVAGLYDASAPLWRDWLYRDAHRALDQALITYLPPDGRVLDLACGTAANLERLQALGLPFRSYTGVDLSPAMLDQARAKFGHLTQAAFHQLDLMVDPLPEGPFDLIVSTWAFEHLPAPGRVVEKAWEQLRPGGRVVLLFEAEADSWRSRLVERIWRLFSARLLREDEYRRFPGLVSVERFAGAGAPLVLVVLQKQAEET